MPLEYINGTRLYYETYGNGAPIVFIHPPLLTSANFNYQQKQLADEFQVITFDIRGHGRSDRSDIPITYELIARDIKELLDHLKIERAFISGYSTGGSIALEAILAYPNRFEGGILISAMSEVSDFKLRNRIRLAIGLSQWKSTMGLLTFAISWGNSDRKQTFRKLLSDSMNGDPQNIQEYYKYSLNYSCTDQLSQITVPFLLLYGEKDRDFKQYRAKLQQGLRQFKTIILHKEKHQLPTKASAEINKAIASWIHDVIRKTRNRSGKPEYSRMDTDEYLDTTWTVYNWTTNRRTNMENKPEVKEDLDLDLDLDVDAETLEQISDTYMSGNNEATFIRDGKDLVQDEQ